MQWLDFYKSLFVILRIDRTQSRNNAKIAGTGFVINTDPIYVFTCNHVVSEGTQDNNSSIVYAIIKRSDETKEFDLRNVQISYLKAKKIFHKPEYDLAILEIDPSINEEIAQRLGIPDKIKALKINFCEKTRHTGSSVEWISAGTLGDLTLTPRFFKGSVVTRYIKDHRYKFKNPRGDEQSQLMKGISLLEIDQLFLPGCSGSPVISTKKKEVIGYVHGFSSWPIPTSRRINYEAEILENSSSRNVNIKSRAMLVASLSLAIDVKNVEDFLIQNNFVQKSKLLLNLFQ